MMAAERLRRIIDNWIDDGTADRKNGAQMCMRFRDAIENVVAGDPSSDPMRVMRPFLKRFKYLDGNDFYGDWLVAETPNGCVTLRWFAATEHVEESVSMYYASKMTHRHPTVGDVYRLCAALGIELGEPPVQPPEGDGDGT